MSTNHVQFFVSKLNQNIRNVGASNMHGEHLHMQLYKSMMQRGKTMTKIGYLTAGEDLQ